jgi:NitT/TauT family transport system substrate-binding protein
MRVIKSMLLVALAVAGSGCLASSADAADPLRIAVQKTGTASWEIELIKARGLDKAVNLDIETIELASTDAAKVALMGGGADMIAEDWLWAARERALGDKLLFTPYSTTLGAVMAPKDSQIHTVADLAGRSIGVAGGPLDKSWLLLRAMALGSGLDLTEEARPSYGAPPLIAEKLVQGETDATLEYWNFSADLEGRGFRRAIEMADVEKALGASGAVAMTGYVFSEAFAASHKDVLRRYFTAAAEARKILAEDPSAWAPIKAPLERRRSARRLSPALPRRCAETNHRRAGRGRARPVSPIGGGRRRGAGRQGQGARPRSLLRPLDERIGRDDASHLARRALCLVANRCGFRQSSAASRSDDGAHRDEVRGRVGRPVSSARRHARPRRGGVRACDGGWIAIG